MTVVRAFGEDSGDTVGRYVGRPPDMSAVMAQMGSMRRVLPAFRSFVRAIDMQTSAIRTGKDHVHRRRIIRVGTGVDKQPDKRPPYICVAPDAGRKSTRLHFSH